MIQLKPPRAQATAQGEPPHAGPREILLEVNGVRHPVTVEPQMTLALDVGERKMVTIGALAQGEALHPLQEAFAAHDAMQCRTRRPCLPLVGRGGSSVEAPGAGGHWPPGLGRAAEVR